MAKAEPHRDDDEYFTGTHVDRRYKISRATRYRWIREGFLPRPVRFGPGAPRWKRSELGSTFAAYENETFTIGDGNKRPKGLLTYPIVANPTFGQLRQIKSGVAGGVAADKLIEAALSLKARYLANASWIMSSATQLLIAQLKNPTTGDYLWRTGLGAGQPNTLLGHPVVINEHMPAPATDSHSIAFGDFKRAYKIADVRGTRLVRDPYTKKGFVYFYTWKRTGGGLEDSTAVVIHTLGV